MDRLIAEIKVDKDELREVAKEVFERNFDGMTNEEVIKILFPKAVLHTEDDDMYLSFQQGVYLEDKDATWLNAPYKGERERREEIKDTSDVLTVSFDSGSKDESALCVTRKYGGKTIMLKMELGEQADILYRLLTEQMTKAEIKAERYKDCFQPKSNENTCSSQQDHYKEVAKVYQLGLSFGFIDGLKENNMQESEVEKNDET